MCKVFYTTFHKLLNEYHWFLGPHDNLQPEIIILACYTKVILI